MGKLRAVLATVITIVLTLIDSARKDPEFAKLIREQVLKVIPEAYKQEADKWLCRILDIRATVIEYDRLDRPRPKRRTRYYKKPKENPD